MNNSNYPDDIHQFDNHPQSPFFKDPDTWMEQASVDLAAGWQAELEKYGFIGLLDLQQADVDQLQAEQPAFSLVEILEEKALAEIQARPEQHQAEPDFESLQWG